MPTGSGSGKRLEANCLKLWDWLAEAELQCEAEAAADTALTFCRHFRFNKAVALAAQYR